MVTGESWVTAAGRERLQMRAARMLAAILDACTGPALTTWSVSPAARTVLPAWQQALGLDDVTQVPASGGNPGRLRARDGRCGVRVTVTAAITGSSW